MVTSLLLMAMIFAVGTRAADSLRVRQEEVILRKLTIPRAAEYYDVLRRRARRVRILRAITFASLLMAILAGRRRFLSRPEGQSSAQHAAQVSQTSDAAVVRPPSNTEAAKAIAAAELAKQAARGVLDARAFQLRDISGDDRHPWIFDYWPRSGADAGGMGRVRVYVDKSGKAELHRIP